MNMFKSKKVLKKENKGLLEYMYYQAVKTIIKEKEKDLL